MTPETTTPPIEALLRHRAWLQRLAASIVVDEARADDLVQRAFLAALERPPAHASHPRAWLATVVRRLLRADDARAARQSERERLAAAPERQEAADAVVAETALQHEMTAAVLALAEPYRTAILLRFSSNLAPRAIAKRTGAPVETVRTRIKRGLELLRAELVKRRVEASRAGGRPEAPREWAVALLGLLDSGMRSAVRRALLTKAGASAATGIVGVVVMTTKVKVACVAIAALLGVAAVYEFTGSGGSRSTSPLQRGETPTAPVVAAPPADLPAPVAAAPTPKREPEALAAKPANSAAPTSAPPAAALAGDCIFGTVRDAAGAPVSGALVVVALVRRDEKRGSPFSRTIEVWRSPQWFRDPLDEQSGQRVETGGDGTFHVKGLPIGATVDVGAVHRTKGLTSATGLVLDSSRLPLRVDLVLERGCVVTGTVCDLEGRPIEGAALAMEGTNDKGTWGTADAKSAADGSFEFLPGPFRNVKVRAAAKGCIVDEKAGKTDRDDGEIRLEFRLDRARHLNGRVLSISGGSANLAEIPGELRLFGSPKDPRMKLMGAPIDWREDRGKVVRGEDRYEFEYVDRAIKYVSLWRGTLLLGSAEITDIDRAPDLVVDVAIPPLENRAKGTIEVTAVDGGRGDALRAFIVELEPVAANVRGESSEQRRDQVTDGAPSRFVDLALGDYTVDVRAEGYAPRRAAVHLGKEHAVERVRVELLRATSSLRGRVASEDGKPIEKATLRLCGADGGLAIPGASGRVKSGPDGEFEFEGIPDGDFSIVAEAKGFAPAVVSAHAGAFGIQISMSRGVKVVLVLRREGKPFEGMYEYRVRDAEGRIVIGHELKGINGGARRALTLLPGAYSVELFAGLFGAGPVRFDAAEGVEVPIDLVSLPGESGAH